MTNICNLQCDFITVSQFHREHQPFYQDELHSYDHETGDQTVIYTPRTVRHPLGGSFQVKSDGQRVSVSGNPSSWGRSSNVFGVDVDTAKLLLNVILTELELPVFHGDGENTARFSRADFCLDFETGSPENKRDFLLQQQGIEFPRLVKALVGLSTYYGRASKSRTFRVYDKAEEFALKHPDQPEMAEHLEAAGAVRIELQARDYLRSKGLRHWNDLTSKSGEAIIRPEVERIVKATKVDHDVALAQLSPSARMWYHAWRAREDVRKLGSPNTVSKYRREILSVMGIDIAAIEVAALPPRKLEAVELVPLQKPRSAKRK